VPSQENVSLRSELGFLTPSTQLGGAFRFGACLFNAAEIVKETLPISPSKDLASKITNDGETPRSFVQQALRNVLISPKEECLEVDRPASVG
jgi:hypothetical protein